MQAKAKHLIATLAAAPVVVLPAGPTFAHAFGARYELPVPVWLFIVGGAFTVTLTFVLIAVFARVGEDRHTQSGRDISQTLFGRVLRHPLLSETARAMMVFFAGLVVIAGLIGKSDPNHNIAPTLVWIVWWVGFSYVVMLIGNPWPALNPWRATFDWVAAFSRRLRPGRPARAPVPYPARLATWPAVVMLLAFGWLELIFPFASKPLVVALLVIVYSAITWAGMSRYGPDTWLNNVDPFHLVFETFSRFAPLAAESHPDADDTARLVVRPYAAGLMQPGHDAVSTPIVCFVLAMLSIVLFDGLLGSGHWTLFENAIHDFYPRLGDVGWVLVHTAGFLFMWLLFLGLFVGTCWLMAIESGAGKSVMDIARLFTLTLVPIAIGYHVAHTFTYLLVQGQEIINLISDPFGFGWDLFGTKGYEKAINVMTTKTTWYLSVGVIVAGHVISVYLAHVAAGRLVSSRARTLRCLVPMTALMVVYTVISLQILAEPLVRYSGPNKEIVLLLQVISG
jgi:hypothetical protein